MAGYSMDVPWLDSTIVDVLFWRELWKDGDPWEAALRTYTAYSKAVELGFSVFRMRGKKSKLQSSLEHFKAAEAA
jgi:hypothetical protein